VTRARNFRGRCSVERCSLSWCRQESTAGTLHALIRRAAADGLIVESGERPDIALDDERRRYYRLTPLGRRVAAAEVARLESIVEMARQKKLVIGLLLAAIGLYGVIAYHVSQRTKEIGVRMALGARSSDILRGVLLLAARYAGIGAVLGVVPAVALGLLVRGLLLDVSPFDPQTYLTVAVVLLAVGLIAALVPARRATKVDPLTALRAE